VNTNVFVQQLSGPAGPDREFLPIPSAMEVRFLDTQGNLLDLHTAETNALTVPPCLWLTGLLTNKGSEPWLIRNLELRIFDTNKNLVDGPHFDLYTQFRINPHQERAFRVALGDLGFTNPQPAYSVRIYEADTPDER
jgi:hypothetical protein